jgi:Ni/Fe-hydrogenase 1 B-type cytochrome subunit
MANEVCRGEEITSTFAMKKVYDPFLRLLHLWNGLCVFSLLLTMWFKGTIKAHFTNGSDMIYLLHVYIGFGLSGGICARILWGFFGPKNARFKHMFFLKEWIQVLKTRKIESSHEWGHDKYASLIYLAFYFMMIYQVISGLCLAAHKFGIGPFSSFILQSKEKIPLLEYAKEIHEIFYYATMVYIVMHIGGLLIHEIKEKTPMAQSMLSGYQYRKKKD